MGFPLSVLLMAAEAPLAAIAVATFLAGVCIDVYEVTLDTALQKHVPPEALFARHVLRVARILRPGPPRHGGRRPHGGPGGGRRGPSFGAAALIMLSDRHAPAPFRAQRDRKNGVRPDGRHRGRRWRHDFSAPASHRSLRTPLAGGGGPCLLLPVLGRRRLDVQPVAPHDRRRGGLPRSAAVAGEPYPRRPLRDVRGAGRGSGRGPGSLSRPAVGVLRALRRIAARVRNGSAAGRPRSAHTGRGRRIGSGRTPRLPQRPVPPHDGRGTAGGAEPARGRPGRCAASDADRADPERAAPGSRSQPRLSPAAGGNRPVGHHRSALERGPGDRAVPDARLERLLERVTFTELPGAHYSFLSAPPELLRTLHSLALPGDQPPAPTAAAHEGNPS